MCDYDEPLYLISVVAKILGVHPQTLRQYEKEGLIEPSRTDGKMRLYSQRDMDKIKTILRLTRDMGVNLAGVDIILRLKEKLDELDNLNKELQDALHKHSKNNKTPTK
ncbi:MerR family transcriptional regulator, partial [Helicobacter pylori]